MSTAAIAGLGLVLVYVAVLAAVIWKSVKAKPKEPKR